MGQVFDDVNGNGSYDSNEPVIVGVTIILTKISPDGQATAVVAETNSQGIYQFVNLPNVDYRINFIMPSDYTPSDDLFNQVSATGIGSVDAPYSSVDNLYLPIIN